MSPTRRRRGAHPRPLPSRLKSDTCPLARAAHMSQNVSASLCHTSSLVISTFHFLALRRGNQHFNCGWVPTVGGPGVQLCDPVLKPCSPHAGPPLPGGLRARASRRGVFCGARNSGSEMVLTRAGPRLRPLPQAAAAPGVWKAARGVMGGGQGTTVTARSRPRRPRWGQLAILHFISLC